ncbi:hypothetical protein QCD60_19930 [Pokkaliibacter sp. MBI-7]|uniref:hypothetical protein n=1 Tax=Pokkaliibacter sp. MBI-7 TaxID=3040600 RepID=UPI002448BF34|nr:hypothetical protein [Pokkaliibacter sp. MBI-7]MDH2434815.1 hypothetical protein [Pokkaliibacter sp. MBI-7]
MTYSISPILAQQRYPDAEFVGMGSLAGYLAVTMGETPYRLVLPSNTLIYQSRYFTAIDVRNLEDAAVTPEVAEVWVRAGLHGDYRYQVSTNDAGQVSVFVMSDVPWTMLLNPRAEQGQRVSIPVPGKPSEPQ